MKNNLSEYLNRAYELGILPNFWLAEEYLKIQDITVETNNKVIWIQEGEWALFPPLPLYGSLRDTERESPALKIWSDFANYTVGSKLGFLDWEYMYDPYAFHVLKGSRWAVFRKNSRKWPRNKKWEYSPTPPPDKDITALLLKWLGNRPEESIEDFESMEWFLFNGLRRGFVFEQDRLVGINAWDGKYPYLMYRYCVTDPDEPFLDEFTRLLFYQNTSAQLVIDGGTLGNAGLERFKDKLNPISKRKVYSRRLTHEKKKR